GPWRDHDEHVRARTILAQRARHPLASIWHGQNGPQWYVGCRWQIEGLRNRRPSHRRCFHSAARNNRKYNGALCCDRRACRRDTSDRTQAIASVDWPTPGLSAIRNLAIDRSTGDKSPYHSLTGAGVATRRFKSIVIPI